MVLKPLWFILVFLLFTGRALPEWDDRIPNAELHVYEGGHGFFAQDATAFPDVFTFLAG